MFINALNCYQSIVIIAEKSLTQRRTPGSSVTRARNATAAVTVRRVNVKQIYMHLTLAAHYFLVQRGSHDSYADFALESDEVREA